MAYILCANDLRSGDVIYWCAEGWRSAIANAITAPDAAFFDAISAQNLQAAQIVDPYVIEVAGEGATLWPIKFREQVRAAGPTVRSDLARFRR